MDARTLNRSRLEAVWLTVLLAASPGELLAGDPPRQTRPNVILLITDK